MPSQVQLQQLLTAKRAQRIHPATTAFQQLLAGEAKAGDGYRAELWFRRMVWSKCAPDVASYTSVIAAFARAGEPRAAEAWLRRMELRGLRVPVATCNAVLDAFAKRGRLRAAEWWFSFMTDSDIQPDHISFGAPVSE
ncbi:PPR5 [Symbiodinium natans]|uniref:PPR5 protein n=1 Tax=Symbiodinium natans TaxID=878477 RepID=A0A812HMR8_9DINO|nr:PPR5 [Symbiodinium natans]